MQQISIMLAEYCKARKLLDRMLLLPVLLFAQFTYTVSSLATPYPGMKERVSAGVYLDFLTREDGRNVRAGGSRPHPFCDYATVVNRQKTAFCIWPVLYLVVHHPQGELTVHGSWGVQFFTGIIPPLGGYINPWVSDAKPRA